jgi:hypothetical protein
MKRIARQTIGLNRGSPEPEVYSDIVVTMEKPIRKIPRPYWISVHVSRFRL